MTGVHIAISREFFGWPLYALVMAAGQVDRTYDRPLPFLTISYSQMLSATSFQVTLLSGQNW
jgi:alpha-1,3-glucan synthase